MLVGSAVHHIINLASRTHFNVGTGDAFRLELRQVVAPRQLLLQVELDDEEWHCYNAQVCASFESCLWGRVMPPSISIGILVNFRYPVLFVVTS